MASLISQILNLSRLVHNFLQSIALGVSSFEIQHQFPFIDSAHTTHFAYFPNVHLAD